MRVYMSVTNRSVLVVCVSLLSLAVANCGYGAANPAHYVTRPDAWFRSSEAAVAARNVISHQSSEGGWPKNIDTSQDLFRGSPSELKPTFDNSATTGELRFLARMYVATTNRVYRESFERGYDYILKAQYENGGWPQTYPPGNSYSRYITFNDNAMVRLMLFLRETYTDEGYGFINAGRVARAKTAFEKGIDCILRCQVKVGTDHKPTAWCAQHDEKDFSARPARSYELVSLSGSESVGIVELLMSLEAPKAEVVHSVESAIAWFKEASIPGIKVVRVADARAPKGLDKRVVSDPEARPMWARFYEIGTNRPIFCDRDGIPKASLAEIGYERRNGYNWLDYWPADLLTKEHPAWKKRVAAQSKSG